MRTLQTTVIVMGILIGGAVAANAGDMGLVDLLTRQLGVTTDQAEGGAGAIFSTAKQELSPDEYDQVSDAVPEATTLLDKAPKPEADADTDSGSEDTGGMAGSLGDVTSALGGGGSSIAGAAQAAGGMGALSESFSSLGMSPDMVGKFIPVVLDYAQSKGGDAVMSLLKGALL